MHNPDLMLAKNKLTSVNKPDHLSPHNPYNPHNPHNPQKPQANYDKEGKNLSVDLIKEVKTWFSDQESLTTCLHFEQNDKLLINKELWIKCLLQVKRREKKMRGNI